MREPTERDVNKKYVLLKCFKCLTKIGVEQITTRNFSDETGMATSSLYYWFKDKDELIVDATEFGLHYIVEKLFRYALDNINNVEYLCNEFYKIADEYKMELRLILQIVNSPKYGERIREHSGSLSRIYDEYTDELAEAINVNCSDIRGVVDLFISTITYYVMWEDKDKLQHEIDKIKELLICNKNDFVKK